MVVGWLKVENLISALLLCPSTTLWWSYQVFVFVDMMSLQYILTRSPDTCNRRSDQSARQIGSMNDVTVCVVPLLFSPWGRNRREDFRKSPISCVTLAPWRFPRKEGD